MNLYLFCYFRNILLRGGNAVDAVIGAMICDGVTILPSMGIGGGFVMVIYNKTHENVTVINAREKAPGASTVDMFHEDPKLSRTGAVFVCFYYICCTIIFNYEWE